MASIGGIGMLDGGRATRRPINPAAGGSQESIDAATIRAPCTCRGGRARGTGRRTRGSHHRLRCGHGGCGQGLRVRRRADYFAALGVCANTGPGGNLDQCLSEADSARDEAKLECAAQEQARNQVCAALGQPAYDPQIGPADFVRGITNPYFPLQPGTVFTCRGEDVVDTVEVLKRTVVVQGVRCVVVRDTNIVDGALEEDTFDYYAQDRAGNVWYFGEASTDYEGGAATSTEGSWPAGVGGAKPGIVMPAKPLLGSTYRQEFALGDAEDLARVESQGVRVHLPGKRIGKALQTFDFTPLEPGAREH